MIYKMLKSNFNCKVLLFILFSPFLLEKIRRNKLVHMWNGITKSFNFIELICYCY